MKAVFTSYEPTLLNGVEEHWRSFKGLVYDASEMRPEFSFHGIVTNVNVWLTVAPWYNTKNPYTGIVTLENELLAPMPKETLAREIIKAWDKWIQGTSNDSTE